MRGSINCSFRALGGLQNVNGPKKRVFREKLTLDTQGARKEVHEAPHGVHTAECEFSANLRLMFQIRRLNLRS